MFRHSKALFYCATERILVMKLIKDILKGVLIGISNIIPGVSGGTMAVSMGIYDTLISALTNLFKDFKNSVKTLFPYLIGMLLGIGGLSFVIGYLFSHYPLPTSLLFIGLILGGLPSIANRLKGNKISVPNVILFLIFFASIILLQYFSKENVRNLSTNFEIGQTLMLLLIGIITSATMVIPGVSGSLVLMLIGYYQPVIDTIRSFIHGALKFESSAIVGGLVILIPFGIGVVVGMFAIAKLIEFLLSKFEVLTYSSILGLVVASPIVVLMRLSSPTINLGIILASILCFAAGFVISLKLGNE